MARSVLGFINGVNFLQLRSLAALEASFYTFRGPRNVKFQG